MRPIDADAFKKYIDAQEGRLFIGCTVGEAMKILIDEQPTIQPENAQLSQEGTTKGTTSDLISRRAALDAVEKNACNTQRIMDAVNNLPSAQPEPHEGYWILHESPDGGEQYECSECGVLWEFTDGTPEDNEAYYCPKCGADLRGE